MGEVIIVVHRWGRTNDVNSRQADFNECCGGKCKTKMTLFSALEVVDAFQECVVLITGIIKSSCVLTLHNEGFWAGFDINHCLMACSHKKLLSGHQVSPPPSFIRSLESTCLNKSKGKKKKS